MLTLSVLTLLTLALSHSAESVSVGMQNLPPRFKSFAEVADFNKNETHSKRYVKCVEDGCLNPYFRQNSLKQHWQREHDRADDGPFKYYRQNVQSHPHEFNIIWSSDQTTQNKGRGLSNTGSANQKQRKKSANFLATWVSKPTSQSAPPATIPATFMAKRKSKVGKIEQTNPKGRQFLSIPKSKHRDILNRDIPKSAPIRPSSHSQFQFGSTTTSASATSAPSNSISTTTLASATNPNSAPSSRHSYQLSSPAFIPDQFRFEKFRGEGLVLFDGVSEAECALYVFGCEFCGGDEGVMDLFDGKPQSIKNQKERQTVYQYLWRHFCKDLRHQRNKSRIVPGIGSDNVDVSQQHWLRRGKRVLRNMFRWMIDHITEYRSDNAWTRTIARKLRDGLDVGNFCHDHNGARVLMDILHEQVRAFRCNRFRMPAR